MGRRWSTSLCFPALIALTCMMRSVYSDLGADREALLNFMERADLEHVLNTNWTGKDPCAGIWKGVGCQRLAGTLRVTRLELENDNLTGALPLDTVGQLTELRVFSLKRNSLKGRIPSDLSRCTNLQKLYLNFNVFDGPIPDSLSSLRRLDRLVLSNNRLTGTIPASLGRLRKLLTLRLDVNLLTGHLPDLSGLSELKEFNVSWNQLSGPVPAAMANRDIASLVGNPELCGKPVSSNCKNDDVSRFAVGKRRSLSKQVIAIIVIAACIALVAAISGVVFCYKCRNSVIESRQRSLDVEPAEISDKKVTKASADLIFVRKEDRDSVELPDLLHASAQLLGRGSLGSTYRAVCAGGQVVAVKRLVDKTGCSKKVFERRMKIVGRLTHPNLLPLRAYYFYAKVEKLLVYDYMPRGSLHSLLHGGASSGRNLLSWSMRLQIAQGVAKCLRFLHHQCKLPHGNIKSSNVLLNDKYEARVSDFGLSIFMAHGEASNGYTAPECSSSSSTDLVNRKADVYSYGILLLELLTGKLPQADTGTRTRRRADDLPSWVIAVANEQVWRIDDDMDVSRQEQVMDMFKVALLCIARQPDTRPGMNQVVRMIEDIDLMAPSPDYSLIQSFY